MICGRLARLLGAAGRAGPAIESALPRGGDQQERYHTSGRAVEWEAWGDGRSAPNRRMAIQPQVREGIRIATISRAEGDRLHPIHAREVTSALQRHGEYPAPGFTQIIWRGFEEHPDHIVILTWTWAGQVGPARDRVGGIRDDMESDERDIQVRRYNIAMPDAHTQPGRANDQQHQAERDRNREALSQALRVHLLLQ
jgi:hypothetical protein